MRTTIRLRDDLLAAAKRKAAEGGTTLTSVIEQALVLYFSSPRAEDREPIELLVSKASGGLQPGVDLNNARSLLDLMERN